MSKLLSLNGAEWWHTCRDFSHRAIADHIERNWCDCESSEQSSGSGLRNVASAHDDWHLISVETMNRTYWSWQLTESWLKATSMSLFTAPIRMRLLQCGLLARFIFYIIFSTQNHQFKSLQYTCLDRHSNVAIGNKSYFSRKSSSICDTLMVT